MPMVGRGGSSRGVCTVLATTFLSRMHMDSVVLTVRLPAKLVEAINQISEGDGLSKAPPRSTVIRELLTKQVRAERRRLSR